MKYLSKYGVWLVMVVILAYLVKQYYDNKPKLEAGVQAPEFVFTALNGETYDKSSFGGKYVLIDFWGSWCLPCRAANAELKSLYREVQANEKYMDNFSIVSIGYEEDSTKWLNAIEEQNLTWPIQVMEYQRGDVPLTSAFKIVAFPSNYLLDPQGRIVGVNVSSTAVISRLKKL